AAGEWTKRQGYSFNDVTGSRIDGRDLWSSRVSIALKPFEGLQATLVWNISPKTTTACGRPSSFVIANQLPRCSVEMTQRKSEELRLLQQQIMEVRAVR